MPVAAPVAAGLGFGAFLGNVEEDGAIRFTPGIFTVGGFVGVVVQVADAELVHLAVLHPAKTGKVAFRQVVRRAIVSSVFLAVIDAPGVVFGMKRIVGIGLVGADGGALFHEGFGQLGDVGLVLGLQNERDGLARALQDIAGGVFRIECLAHHEHAALVGLLVGGKAAVDPVGFFVLRADMAVDVSAVHVNFAGQGLHLPLFHQRFTDFVRQDEGSLVLNIEIAGKLQGGNALHRVGEDGDRGQVHLQRQLVEGEDRAACHRKGVVTRLAAPLPAGRQKIMTVVTAATWTGGFITLSPTHFPENLEGFPVAHLEHLPNREGPGLGGEKEVLRHFYQPFELDDSII